MKKYTILLLLIIPVVLIGLFFYFGLHTYFTSTEIDEALPEVSEVPQAFPQASSQASPQASSQPSSKSKTIAVGLFREVDFVHKGSGQAKIIEINGQTILRLENFNVTSGPDLYVYLSDSVKPTNNKGDLGNYVNLGVLKATSGNQNYDVPSGFEGYRTAIIWCERFSVLFSFAVMK